MKNKSRLDLIVIVLAILWAFGNLVTFTMGGSDLAALTNYVCMGVLIIIILVFSKFKLKKIKKWINEPLVKKSE